MVPLIAYTPELYTVHYGTSLGSLTSYPKTVAGSTNYSSVDLEYLLEITGLDFDTLYYFYIEASNTEEDKASSLTLNFTTLTISGTVCMFIRKWRDMLSLPPAGVCLVCACIN